MRKFLIVAGLLASSSAVAQQAIVNTSLSPPVPAAPRAPAVIDSRTCAQPVWPREALRWEQTGTVTLRFLIGEDGWVQDSQVVRSSDYPLLDFAALDGIEKCHFRPAMAEGKPQASWHEMKYVWTLESDPNDDAPALARLQTKIEQGDRESMYWMAVYQWKGGNSAVPKDPAAGIAAMTRLADGGFMLAQETLAIGYMNGYDMARDPVQAAAWFRQAALQGSSTAQFRLAGMLREGKGVPRDERDAMQWYAKAATNGIPQGYLAAAEILLASGKTEDNQGAVKLLRRVSLPRAQYLLAECYESGRGVERDVVKAKELYLVAAQGGVGKARAALARLALP